MNAHLCSRDSDLGPDAQAGFTLLEMMISIVLLTIIIGAVSAAVVSSMSSTSATRQRVNASDDAQLIAGFLTRDAQAAGGTDPTTGIKDPTLGVWEAAFAVAPSGGCDADPPGTPILGFKWIDLASGTTYFSNYSYVATATGAYQPQQFLRTVCSRTSAGVANTGTSVLANDVVTTATANLSTPKAWCDTDRAQVPPCPIRFPKTVSMGVSVTKATQSLTPPFSFILTASLRPQSDSQPDIGSSATTASLLVLGGGDCIDAQSASFNLTIYGSTALSSCTINLNGNDTATPFGPVFVSAPGTCANFPASPPCEVVNTSFSDPFQTLIDSGALAPPPVNCSSGPPAVVGGHWQPGTYPQDPQAGGVEHPFDPGVYVFCDGLSGDVTANLQGGPIGGTFFYFAGGSYNVCLPYSNGCQANVQIAPPTSGQYDGLAIWQKRQDPAATPPMVMSKGLVNIAGTVYAPSAVVEMKDGNININQLIAWRIDANPGNPDVHVGPPLRVIMRDQTAPYTLPPYTRGQLTYAGDTAVAVDGTGVYSNWTISGVSGLTISNGVIGGRPDATVTAGVKTVTVGVDDSDGEHATLTAQITIYPTLRITGSLPDWTVNQPGYPLQPLTASGGSGTGYTWAATGMPDGLPMNPDGSIGSFDTPITTGAFNPTITLTDSIGDVTTINPTVIIYPAVTVVSITSTNTNGLAEQGDTVIITFTSAIKPDSVCSTWVGGIKSTSNKTTLVTVTRNPPGGNNTLAVTDSSAGECTFNIFSGGLLDLGAVGYALTGGTPPKTADFGSPSNNCGGSHHCSQVSLDATNTILTITLGDLVSGGSVGPVITNPGITYTPDPAILGAGGAPVSGIASDTDRFF
jgi:prepilin-type N-terminal cleavage/methylation domain-containing protein